MNLTTKYAVVKVNNMMYVRVCVHIHVKERMKKILYSLTREENLVKLQ